MGRKSQFFDWYKTGIIVSLKVRRGHLPVSFLENMNNEYNESRKKWVKSWSRGKKKTQAPLKKLLESAVFIDAEPHAISCQQFIYNV